MKPLAGLQRFVAVAKGDAPADLVIANARVVNTFDGEIEDASVAVVDGKVAGVGDYSRAETVIDLEGRYLAPGLINGHVHLESSMLDVGQYARAVVPRGTTVIVTDLHEIANVCGLAGIRYVLDAARHLPFDLFLMAPSCVPATHLETSGAVIGPEEIRTILKYKETIGLGEVMNYPGVLSADDDMLRKVVSARGKAVDGHAPGVGGRRINAYIGAGIRSDHESVTLAEAAEKLHRGMYVMIREGSTEKNLEELLPLVTSRTCQRCFFVVDDRNCKDIYRDGDIDAVVRKAIRLGVEPVRAVQLATINPAQYFQLAGRGAVAPGYYADMIVLEDLDDFRISEVYYRGRSAARDGRALFEIKKPRGDSLDDTFHIKPFGIDALRLPAKGRTVYAIGLVPGQIITKKLTVNPKVEGGFIVSDPSRDILKAAVVERHKATGNIGVGLVQGLGLKRGALASSVAHDSHNIVAAGVSDEDIYTAVNEVARLHGGLAVAADGQITGSLMLPVAGLLSREPLESVAAGLEKLEDAARALGCTLDAPFAALSFLALPVIPELRLTDLGLVDVNAFKLLE